MTNTEPFPPSFDDSPLSYGFALFSLTLITSLSLAQLMHYLFEARARRAAQEHSYNEISPRIPLFAASNVYRMVVSGFLITVMFGAMPDVLFLMFWGEVNDRTINAILLGDRIFDGLTIIPFSGSILLCAWSAQALPQRLMQAVAVPLAPMTWQVIRDRLRIVAVVLLIAVLVTLGKASA